MAANSEPTANEGFHKTAAAQPLALDEGDVYKR